MNKIGHGEIIEALTSNNLHGRYYEILKVACFNIL